MTDTNPAPTLSTAARSVAVALSGAAEVTVGALSESAGVSKSTASKTLVMLEQAGAATRLVRETGGFRESDLWSPLPELGPLLFAASTGDGYGHASRVLSSHAADDAGSSDGSGAVGSDVQEAVPQRDGESTDSADVDEHPAREAGEPAVPSAPATEHKPVGSPPRLARGGLEDLVAAVLAAHPELDYTPVMVSHLLSGRSSGAIANALERQVAAGTAVRTCEAPKRYRHAVAGLADVR
ncbi:MarR family transcriptional regulator [Catenulispora sp. NL8]|uniref:MarR family transcriptional regulator n=1 Tax=Catenulispora pinistramenti TaxID=2705254 RepID=A0ABS5KJ47_9ACTN|nr:MarR family transcriptional regulator [Catenulispora pinistramenti]MBS2545494.1 MarR family transcriptional regulator [Catenulispora pinistramenti]